MGASSAPVPRPTSGGRPARGPARPRWRRGSSPIPRPVWTSCRSSSPAALHGQADSDAFLDAMIEQLNALGPVGGQSPPVAGARVGVWLSLLAGAAAQAEERARRLVVVVDGLDEDEAGASPPRGRPSIASLASPPPSSWSPVHHHQPPRPWPARRCAVRSPAAHLRPPPPAGVVGGRGRGKARQAGTTGPARRRSDCDRRGRLYRRVWRRPDQERPVGAHRGSPAQARL